MALLLRHQSFFFRSFKTLVALEISRSRAAKKFVGTVRKLDIVEGGARHDHCAAPIEVILMTGQPLGAVAA